MNTLKAPDSAYIHDMFDRLASGYDLFNRVVSLGLDSGWRKAALVPVKEGMRVLDLGCGTGDLALGAIKKVGARGEVTGLDFSGSMLAIAQKRYEKLGFNGNRQISFVLKKAEELPIDRRLYDVVLSGFVLRNIYENIDAILDGVRGSLKEGGEISFLDITEPKGRLLLFFWKLYMNTYVAACGKMLFGKDYPMLYLTQSAQRFLKVNEFIAKLKEKGFKDIRVKKFMMGSIVLYQAQK